MERFFKIFSFVFILGSSLQITAQSYKLIKGSKVEWLDASNHWVEIIPMAGNHSVLSKDAFVRSQHDFEVRDQKTGAVKKCGPAPKGERLMTLIAKGYKSKIIPGTASTQPRGKTEITPITESEEAVVFSNFHYLLVDINHFEDHHWDSLKVPHTDIDTLDTALSREMVPSNNYILRNRTILNRPESTISDSIRYHLDKLANAVRRNSKDIVLLYFASHGESSRNGEYNIIVSDSKYDTLSNKITNAITADELNKYVKRMTDRGARVMVFVDACRAGSLINALDGNSIVGSIYYLSTDSKNNAYAYDGKSRFAEALINAVSGKECYYFTDNKVYPVNLDKYIRGYAENDSLSQYPQMMNNIISGSDLLWIIKPKSELFTLEQKAEEGDVYALIKLGDLYYYGSEKFSLPCDSKRAYNIFKQAYEKYKSPRAAAKLGVFYFYGSDAVLQDYEKSIFYFQESVKGDDNLGKYYLSVCYAKGKGTTKDENKSKEIYGSISLFDEDVVNAFASEGVTYKLEKMNLADKFETKYVTWTEIGDGRGNYWRPKKKKKKELYWLVNNLGAIGVKDNNDFTSYWTDPIQVWRKREIQSLEDRIRSEQSSEAMVRLGEMYLEADKPETNLEEASKLFTKAANLGNPEAIFMLGYCYEMGYGVKQDFAMAKDCYIRANNKGILAATFRLGCLYYVGDEYLPQNYSIAANYWQKSAKKKGAVISQYNFGICCIKGIGVNKNEKEGLKWIKRAAKYGYKRAVDYLNEKSALYRTSR